jgi:hypothetical protein
MSRYHRALQKARKPITEIPAGMTRAFAVEAIAEITEELRGPMSNTERVMLVHDRQDHRDILALIDKQDAEKDGKDRRGSEPASA